MCRYCGHEVGMGEGDAANRQSETDPDPQQQRPRNKPHNADSRERACGNGEEDPRAAGVPHRRRRAEHAHRNGGDFGEDDLPLPEQGREDDHEGGGEGCEGKGGPGAGVVHGCSYSCLEIHKRV